MTGPIAPNRFAREPLLPARGDAVESRLREQRKRLAQLMRSSALTSGEITLALAELTELASELLGCERACVWQLGVDGNTLDLVDAFTYQSRQHTRGVRLSAAEHPRHFAALQGERTLAVADARDDPRTSELEASYLAALDVRALLAAPVFMRGRLVGVVGLEHVGAPRPWQFWEELVAGTLADFVALVLTAREQLRVESQLSELRARVDEMLESRTNQVVRENADLQREVDALQLAALAIRKSEDDLRKLFAASPVPMLLVRGADQRVLLANEVCASALRTEASELYERSASELFLQPSDAVELFESVARGSVQHPREVQIRARDGEVFWALVSGRGVSFSKLDAVMIGFTDLTAQKAVEHQLRVLAQRDPLTQAYNRHHFWQLANTEMARVTRYRRPLSLAMIDADHFKQVNDAHGHQVGDLVLKLIVDTCHESLRKNDVLARYGGEEFIVLLPETPVDGAQAVVERLRERIAETPLELDAGGRIWVTVSIGLSGLTSYDEGFESVLERADEALYEAKRRGRNRVEVG